MLRNDGGETKLSFIAEWFDPHPQVIHRYLLKFYPKSQEVEMKDLKGTRKFLKRTKVKLPEEDFFLDAVVVIFSRDLKLVAYGDDETQFLLKVSSEKAIAVLTDCGSELVAKILSMAEKAGLTLVTMRSIKFDNATALFDSVNMELRGPRAMIELEAIAESMKQDTTIKVLCSKSKEGIAFNQKLSFESSKLITPTYELDGRCTCCAIKPHAVKSRIVGDIIQDLRARDLKIVSMRVVHMDRTRASQFHEVYSKLKDYHAMVDELCSGPILAIKIEAKVEDFRAQCGPFDIEMAKSLRTHTIRAKFGTNRIKNAIHCTDLKEDAVNELSFLFTNDLL